MAKQDRDQTKKQVSRRSLLKLAGFGAGAVALAACQVKTAPEAPAAATAAPAAGGAAAPAAATIAPTEAPAAAGGTTLEFWAFAEDRLKFVKEVVKSDAWTKLHPDVTINFRVFPYQEMHDKLLAALTAGSGAPDISDVEISRFSQYIKGDRVGFVPLNDMIGDEINNVYKAAATDPWTWKGKIYGLGNELNTVVLAYRKDVMDSLKIQTPFATWDDYIAAGKQVVAGGKMKMAAVHDLSWGDWHMMVQHAGSTLFDENGNYQGDNDKGVLALQFLHDLVYKHKVAGIAPADAQNSWTNPAYFAAFKADQFVSTWGPPWHFGGMIANVAEQKGKWTAQALPKGLGDSKPTANFGGTGTQITEQSKHVDIAWDLIRLSNLTVAGVLGDFKIRTAYPAYKPAYKDPLLNAPSEFFGGQKIGELYMQIAPDLTVFRQSPYWPEATDALTNKVITPVMQDKKDPKAALTELRTEIDRLKKG